MGVQIRQSKSNQSKTPEAWSLRGCRKAGAASLPGASPGEKVKAKLPACRSNHDWGGVSNKNRIEFNQTKKLIKQKTAEFALRFTG
ncbi:MAG: hypothetical protein QNJ46_06055 [Leptolyngbyaceae cyanobacterium MO_188.B28]|nr:hypothetical protein [Leptolyngbyaceae cyanobacterium MO_188.B28]